MSGEKRPAQEAFGSSSLLVAKRKKSDADGGTAVVKSSGQNGTLIQQVKASSRRVNVYLPIANIYSRSPEQVDWMLPLWN